MTTPPLNSFDPCNLVCLAPLRVESWAVATGIAKACSGGTARVLRTGAGARRSTKAARTILDALARLPTRPGRHAPAAVLTGVAGGLYPGLVAGELVVADTVIGPDGSALAVDLAAAVGVADALRAARLPVRLAPVATAPRLVLGSEPRAALTAATGAAVVDLESSIMAGLSWPGPFVVVRAVVDTPDAELLSAGTAIAGIAALRSLRRAAPAIAAWADAHRARSLSSTPYPV
ncbi:MAG: 1-hydroxy-2-methyl-2-butenyl 4-diphosphate reductase [Actinomycetota bacterium]|nr:1-hydroxy-2-methyl-2-butenyl 4-diphosphate reductase [Actinomycetota bacterium]